MGVCSAGGGSADEEPWRAGRVGRPEHGLKGIEMASNTSRIGSLGMAAAVACAAMLGAGATPPAVAQAPGAPAAPSESRPDPLSRIARSALRERAIGVLEEAAFDEWALARANALEALQRVPRRAEPIARAALVDENLGVRFVGAMTVGELRLSGSIAQVRPLLRDPDPSVRVAAIYALARNNAEVNQTPLAEALMDGEFRVRSQAAFVLGELGNRSAVALLRTAARRLSGPEGEVFSAAERRVLRLQIAEALATLGETDVLHSLRAALYPSSPDEFEATALAIQIIGRLKDRDSAAQLIQLVEYATPETAKRDLEDRVFLYPPEVRLAAATSLALMGYRDGAFVGAAYESDPSEAVRAQVAFLYGAIGEAPEIRRLEAMLDDPSILVRIAAGAGLLEAMS